MIYVLQFSGTYNNTHLELTWEHDSPAVLNGNLRMTEYNLVSIWTNETISEYALISSSKGDKDKKNDDTSETENVHYYGKFGKPISLNDIILQICW